MHETDKHGTLHLPLKASQTPLGRMIADLVTVQYLAKPNPKSYQEYSKLRDLSYSQVSW